MTQSWNGEDHVPTPERITNFFSDIEAVYIKHGFSLGHEDNHGSFLVKQITEDDITWLRQASIEDVWELVT